MHLEQIPEISQKTGSSSSELLQQLHGEDTWHRTPRKNGNDPPTTDQPGGHRPGILPLLSKSRAE